MQCASVYKSLITTILKQSIFFTFWALYQVSVHSNCWHPHTHMLFSLSLQSLSFTSAPHETFWAIRPWAASESKVLQRSHCWVILDSCLQEYPQQRLHVHNKCSWILVYLALLSFTLIAAGLKSQQLLVFRSATFPYMTGGSICIQSVVSFAAAVHSWYPS